MGKKTKARSNYFVPLRASQTTGSSAIDIIYLYYVFRLLARLKDMFILRVICCGWCHLFFCVCQSCWRGQAYCSNECRKARQIHVHREAQRRYRKKEKGRLAHLKAQRRYRMRLVEKSVADRGSTIQPSRYKISSSKVKVIRGRCLQERPDIGMKGHCYFCGQAGVIVSRFPRRKYGKWARKC